MSQDFQKMHRLLGSLSEVPHLILDAVQFSFTVFVGVELFHPTGNASSVGLCKDGVLV